MCSNGYLWGILDECRASEEDPISPSGDPLLLTGVIVGGVLVELVGGVECDGRLSDIAEHSACKHLPPTLLL